MKKIAMALLLVGCSHTETAKTEVIHNWVSPPQDMIVDFQVAPAWHDGKNFKIEQSLKANKVDKK